MQMSERKLSIPQQIEQRAYELYLERGGEHGHDRADWLAAENELTELPEQFNSGYIGLNAEKTLRKSLPHAPVPELYAIT
jgi:hypothetical protein